MTSLNGNSYPYFDETKQYQFGTLDSGNTAFMLAVTAFTLLASMPGLAIYYGGMTKEKDIVACALQVITITSLITFLWMVFGYSLAFAPATSNGHANEVYGNADRLWLRGMMTNTVHMIAPTIPEAIFCAFQLCFAIFTAGLVCSSLASRMRYHSMIILITFWLLIVYCPIAHSTWHPQGWLFKLGVLDYAGGNVVHICSGMSGLATALVIGYYTRGVTTPDSEVTPVRKSQPNNILLTFMGMSFLWFACYGFNAGSAYGANENAAYALLATQIATSISALMWMLIDWAVYKTPSTLSMMSGAIAGLACISPAAGYVDMTGAFFIGFFGGPLCFLGAQLIFYFGFDDALDSFSVHATGGIIGGIAVGFFVTDQVQPLGFGDRLGEPLKGVYYSDLHMGGHQLAIQLVGILFTIGWSFIWTFCIAQIIDKTIGLKNYESDDIPRVESEIWTVSMKKEDNITIVVNDEDGVNAGNRVNSDEAIF